MRRLTLGIVLAGIAAALGLLGRASLTAAGPDDRPEDAKLIFRNEVEGRTSILLLVPNGKRVKKGDLLAELDSAALRGQLVDQEITTKKAEADLMNAKKTQEVAEINLKEYREWTFQIERDRLDDDVALAQSTLELAEEGFKAAQKEATEKPLRAKQAEHDRDCARINLQKAKRAIRVLTEFTHPAVLARRQADIETLRADSRMKNAVFNLEKSKEDRLNRQIRRCKIYSLFAGKVIHSRIDGGDEVKEGTVLRERQEVLRMIPDRDEEKP